MTEKGVKRRPQIRCSSNIAIIIFVISGVLNICLGLMLVGMFEYKTDSEKLDKELADILAKSAELDAEIKRLEESLAQSNNHVEKLATEIEDKKSSIDAKTAEYETLVKRVGELKDIIAIDAEEQLRLTKEMNNLLANPPVSGGVSFYYYDIEHGYAYSYNAEKVFNSASVVKLPYALSLLKAASNAKKIDKDDSFSLDDVFVYTSAGYKDGSGVIKKMSYGTKFTMLELVDYMMRDSDNVAFKALREKYGYEYFESYINDNSIATMQKNRWNMNAKDASGILLDTYEFIKNDTNYGKFLEDAMKGASYTVMTADGVAPKECAHKYGWDTDAYHDAAIVFDEHPYIIVFMSDFDMGGWTVNNYVQNIVRKADEFHSNFYKG